MKVVLRNNAIFVIGNQHALDEQWMDQFFDEHLHNTLFLDNALLVLNNDRLSREKENFLTILGEKYAESESLDSAFYVKSLKRCKSSAIKIELPYQKSKTIDIDVTAISSDEVMISPRTPNRWVMRYLRQQFTNIFIRTEQNAIYIDVSTMESKSRLQKVLDRGEIFHYKLNYLYDNDFVGTLYSYFRAFSFGDSSLDKMLEYRKIFKLPSNAKASDIKKRYYQLAKQYHPDMIESKNPIIINKYSEKFLLIQEAYQALRDAS